MNSKRTLLIKGICLIVMGIGAILLAGSDILGYKLDDTIVRIIGILDLIAIPVFSFFTFKRNK